MKRVMLLWFSCFVCEISLATDYCDLYRVKDGYSDIKYWGKKTLKVEDVRSGSLSQSDAKYLDLIIKEKSTKYGYKENEAITVHFESEFDRIIKGDLPFFDVTKGSIKRLTKLRKEYRDEDYVTLWEVSENARRIALYGEGAAGLACKVEVQGRETPVLFSTRCLVYANSDFTSFTSGLNFYWGADWLMNYKVLGHASSESITGEINKSISSILNLINKELKELAKCD